MLRCFDVRMVKICYWAGCESQRKRGSRVTASLPLSKEVESGAGGHRWWGSDVLRFEQVKFQVPVVFP